MIPSTKHTHWGFLENISKCLLVWIYCCLQITDVYIDLLSPFISIQICTIKYTNVFFLFLHKNELNYIYLKEWILFKNIGYLNIRLASYYLVFQPFDFDRTWWRLFQKSAVRTKFDILRNRKWKKDRQYNRQNEKKDKCTSQNHWLWTQVLWKCKHFLTHYYDPLCWVCYMNLSWMMKGHDIPEFVVPIKISW
jgi:hypothetical protein